MLVLLHIYDYHSGSLGLDTVWSVRIVVTILLNFDLIVLNHTEDSPVFHLKKEDYCNDDVQVSVDLNG